jgi:hypothetical protein
MCGLFVKYAGDPEEQLVRLVPRCRSLSIEGELKAKTKDPLWFLTRQWQMGEFEAMNRGRPINVEVTANITNIEQVSLSENDPLYLFSWDDIPGNDTERLIEFLTKEYPIDYWLKGKIENDGKTIRVNTEKTSLLLELINGKVDLKINGVGTDEFIAKMENNKLKIYDSFQTIEEKDLPLEYVVEGTPRKIPGVELAEAWDTERLEYKFKVKANQTVLSAKEYYGGCLDWYDFDLAGGVPGQGKDETYNVAPTNARFKGMPNSRWWTFEDGNVNLGDISRPNLNFLSMLLIEFSMIFSQEWYVLPLQQEIGSLRLVNSVKLMDSFGNVSEIYPILDTTADESLWSMFSLSGTDTTLSLGSRLLMLPNTVIQPLEGDQIEEVTIARDEVANMAWAIERKYQDSSGIVNRDDVESANPVATIPFSENALQDVYRLMSHVARNWIPYFPIRKSENGGIVFRRGRTDIQANMNDPQFKGKLLKGSVIINEEEIPATPIKLMRYYKLVSIGPEDWELVNDGGVWKLVRRDSKKVRSWVANIKEPDSRQASSDVKFDYIVKKEI